MDAHVRCPLPPAALKRERSNISVRGASCALCPPRRELAANHSRPDLISQHVAVVLLALVEAGLIDALASVTQSANKHLSVRSTILLGDCLRLLRRCVLLPAPRRSAPPHRAT